MSVVEIDLWGLFFCLLLVTVLGLTSLALRLKLAREIIVGTIRTVAQLFLLGYILLAIFRVEVPWIVIGALVGMISFAAWTVAGRFRKRSVPVFWPTYGTMLLSYLVLTFFATAIVVRVKPWYEPQYVIPIGGMLIGNSMNAIAVSLDRLFSALDRDRNLVEQALSLGATAGEASDSALRQAIRAGMIPTINSMMTVGIVFIPGMMTGQILAGADPLIAIRYQIVIMLMILVATGTGSILATKLVSRLCFTRNHQLAIG